VGLIEAARAAGIASGYHDIWGNWREAPAQTLLAALDALGHPGAPDPEALARAVTARLESQSLELLPGTVVVEAGSPSTVRLSTRALQAMGPEAAHCVQWLVLLESGDRVGGLSVVEDGGPGLPLPALPAGRHRLRITDGRAPGHAGDAVPRQGPASGAAAGGAEAVLLCAPAACHLPPRLRDGACEWGIAVQLYGLRSRRNWGIGDFADLRVLVEGAASLGASVLGLNPLHALPLDRPEQSSPYSAVSRLFLHPLYIDPEGIDVFTDAGVVMALCRERAPESARAALRDADRVDYPAIARLKLGVLRAIYDAFVRDECGGDAVAGAAPRTRWGAGFDAFRSGTEGLLLHATYQSIQGALHASDPGVWGWPCWPAALRDPADPAVAAWQHEHAHDVGFHVFLEWVASRQWQAVRARAAASGIQLYGDLALGADRGGSEVWAAQEEHALAISAGCPPDDFNLQGQDWGLPPLRPDRLRANGCAAFRSVLAASMARFDALRLDHVMSLMRLFWIPPGPGASAGAYVDYPFDEMLATLRIESNRHRCMVIGEDLGTVPPAVRDGLRGADVLSYRLLVFERDAPDHFRRPSEYPRLALAAVGSHDLSPLQGWWLGDDLAQRRHLGLLDADQHARFSWERGEARQALLDALAEAGLLPVGESTDVGRYPLLPATMVDAVHAFLARTGSMWTMVNPEDVFELVDATNLPGTTTEHPNWSRRLPVPVEDWAGLPRWAATAATQRARAQPRS
jgi:(1->4)-alpha-D-glucan 1-alpha-D-glucosylmutase